MSKTLPSATETPQTISSGIPQLLDCKRIRLGEVCKIQNGYAFSSSDFVSEGIPVIKMGNISKDFRVRLEPKNFSYMPESFARTYSSFLLRKGDLLITLTDMSPSGEYLGTVAIYDSEMPALLNQRVGRFYDIDKLIDISFLYYLLRSTEFRKYATHDDTGNLQKNTNPDYLYRFELSLPPLPEQKCTAAILNEQMAAVERARAAAEAQLEAAKDLSDAYLQEVFNSPEAKEWKTTPLQSLCVTNGQYGTSVKADASETTGVPVLGMVNIFDGRIRWEKLNYIQLSEKELKKYRLEKGDILFNRTNSAELVGKTAVFDGSREAVFASYLIRLKAHRELADPNYISAYINSRGGRRFIEANMARAIGQVNISASTISKMLVPIPTLIEQRRIVKTLDAKNRATEKILTALSKQLEAINKIPATLLRQAFTG